MTMRRPSSSRRREFGLVLVAVLAAGGLAEITLRAAGITYPIFHRLEERRGWAPWPLVEGQWTKEGNSHVAINAEGFRDREHAVEKPPGTFRIAVLGDSMTEAFGVPIEDTFWSVLEDRLSSCAALGGRNVEVLNFGVAGYGTAQQIITFRHNTLKYNPDLVLLAFYAGNDVINNERTLDGHPDRVYVEMRTDGPVVDARNTATMRFAMKRLWRNAKNTVTNSSHLFQLFRESYYRAKGLWRNRLKHKDEDSAVFDAAAPESAVFRPPVSDAWTRAWSTTEALIAAIADASARSGAEFWLAAISQPAQVYPDAMVREAYRAALGVADLAYPDDRLAAFAARQSIPAVFLTPALRQAADASGQFLHGFPNTRLGTGHLNSRGHVLTGQELARAICDGSGGQRP